MNSEMEFSRPVLQDLSYLEDDYPNLAGCQKWVVTDNSGADDIFWNIVMCYLHDAPIEKTKLDILVDRLEASGKEQNYIKMWNPFIKMQLKPEKDFLRSLRLKTESYYEEHKSEFKSNHVCYKSAQALSSILECNILIVFRNGESGKVLQKLFPDGSSAKVDKPRGKFLILFDKVVGKKETFSFCLAEEIGQQKRESALRNVLKRDFDVNRCDTDVLENLPLALAKRNPDILPALYSSVSAMENLRFSSIATDPMAVDSESNSAVLHALTQGNYHLLYFLYNQAAFGNMDIDSNDRNKNLYLSSYMLEKLTKFEDQCMQIRDRGNDLKMRVDEIIRYNRFHMDICRELGKINLNRKHIKFYCSLNAMQDVECIKNMMCSLFDIYIKYFNIEDNESKAKIWDFQMHNYYFSNIDFYASVLYFDILLLLQEKLVLPNTISSNITTLFFSLNHKNSVVTPISDITKISKLLQERQSLLGYVKNFKKALETHKTSLSDMVVSIPETVDPIINTEPQMYKYLFVSQLLRYLNALEYTSAESQLYTFLVDRTLKILETHRKIELAEYRVVLRTIEDLLNKIKLYCASFRNGTRKEKKKIKLQIFRLFQTLMCIRQELTWSTDSMRKNFASFESETNTSLLPLSESKVIQLYKYEHFIFPNISTRFELLIFKELQLRSFQIYFLHEGMKSLEWVLQKRKLSEETKQKVQESMEIVHAFFKFKKEENYQRTIKDIPNESEQRDMILVFSKRLVVYFNPITSKRLEDHFRSVTLEFAQKLLQMGLPDLITIYNDFKQILNTAVVEPRIVVDSNWKEIPPHLELTISTKTPCDPVLSKIFSRSTARKRKKDYTYRERVINEEASIVDATMSLDKISSSTPMLKELDTSVENSGKLENPDHCQNQLEHLKDQITLLKDILIDRDNYTKDYWESVEEPHCNTYVQEKVAQLFLTQSDIQVAVEMILSNCMNILKTRELAILCNRISLIFSNINIRSALDEICNSPRTHNRPSDHLNCRIRPSLLSLNVFNSSLELIEKLLQLIEDGQTIQYLLDMLQILKKEMDYNIQDTHIERETIYNDFMDVLTDSFYDDDQYTHLKRQILNCDSWQQYAVLISEPWQVNRWQSNNYEATMIKSSQG